MEQKKKVRLSDIAEKLGISTVTVSKALSNKDGVGEELREQIKRLADEMGYRPKKTSGDGKTTNNIGILIPSRFFSPDFSFYWYLFNFLSTELLHRNFYSILELVSDADEKELNVPRILQDQKVDGLIILGQISNDYLDAIRAQYDAFILLDFYTNRMNLDCISNDDYYASYLLTSYVLSMGHRKLRFVGNFGATASITDRYMGFQKALLENGLESSVSQIIKDRDENGLLLKTLDLPYDDLPTALICNNDETAAMAIEQLTSQGYAIPGDISVTGFDDYMMKHKIDIGLTTIHVRPEDIAKAAADLIIRKISGQPYKKGRNLVGGSLVIRDSVKKIG